MSHIVAARAVSIIGHPAVLVPAAIAFSATRHDAPADTVLVALLLVSSVSVAVIAYSMVQVRSGRWAHVDASIPHERSQLNPLLALLLLTVSGACIAAGQDLRIVAGLVLAAALVLVAHLLRRWLKASLHVGFALFAVFLVWPSALASAAVLVMAGAVSWSRLVLQRHTVTDVVGGALLGAVAGGGFLVALDRITRGAG